MRLTFDRRMECQRRAAFKQPPKPLVVIVSTPSVHGTPPRPTPEAWPVSQLGIFGAAQHYQLHLSISWLPSLTLIGFGSIMQWASAALRNTESSAAAHSGEERLHLRSVAYEFLDVERKF